MAGELAAPMEDDCAMRKLCFVLVVLAGSLFGETRAAIAEATESEPDFRLAYVLATASYCAYAVGELDDDHGRARAFECLRAAADKDPVHLERLKLVSTDDVEAYFNRQSPKDAYLLIREKNGVILAFRGTLVPPISPSSGRFAKVSQKVPRNSAIARLPRCIGEILCYVRISKMKTFRHPESRRGAHLP
jgi:hypothetical protein